MNKKLSRLRRSKRTRAKIKELQVPRLSIHRSSMHIYAQVIMPDDCKVVASVSTVQKAIKSIVGNTSNIEAARAVGSAIATKTKKAGITKVAFDRSGFKYHGRVKALAEAAREGGLEF